MHCLIFCLPFDIFDVVLCELGYLRQSINEVTLNISHCGENLLVVLSQSNAILCILYSILYSIFGTKLN